jgi:DNA-binding GntR family transcriptional regulator
VLRNAITSGRFQPGERLVELDLAEQLGTSRGPIREALRQLETEGLIVSYPYRGTEVASVSHEEVEHVLIPIRLIIERFAFLKALPQLDDAALDELGGLVTKMRRAADDEAPDELAEADVRFHELVLQRSEQTNCLQVWRTIEPRVRAYFRRDAPAHSARYAVADQHQRLLDALLSGKPDRVLAELDDHIKTRLEDGVRREPL